MDDLDLGLVAQSPLRVEPITKVPKTALDSAAILDALERRYSDKSGHRFWREVQIGSQHYGRTYGRVDGLALQLYESRGINLHGFEVKVSRSDWLREIRQPEKGEYCRAALAYYSVVVPQGIADPMEVPAGWGMMEVRAADRKIFVKRRPELNRDAVLDLPTIARILTRPSRIAVCWHCGVRAR